MCRMLHFYCADQAPGAGRGPRGPPRDPSDLRFHLSSLACDGEAEGRYAPPPSRLGR